ncbi:MAG TPA: RNA methyltransferase [Pseudogracilibacillus sp.]|nr:RNA methyltransferase [Pseudogracilibacillus sp.]
MIEINNVGMIEMITSVQNQQVKQWKKLHQKKHREKTNSFLVEGIHLVEEAYYSGWEIEMIIVREGTELTSWMKTITYQYVNDAVCKELSQTEAPQGILAVVTMQYHPDTFGSHTLLLDGVQDPGNVGTMIRTADAAGFQHVVLGKGTVDVYNEKVIRASQGSIFHVAISEQPLEDVIVQLKQQQTTIYATALEEATPISHIVPKTPLAIIMGNEGAGISTDILHAADQRITIPILGEAESLNVSVAAGIFMYHMIN